MKATTTEGIVGPRGRAHVAWYDEPLTEGQIGRHAAAVRVPASPTYQPDEEWHHVAVVIGKREHVVYFDGIEAWTRRERSTLRRLWDAYRWTAAVAVGVGLPTLAGSVALCWWLWTALR